VNGLFWGFMRNNMKLSLETIKNMTDNEKILHREIIRKFLFKLSPTELRQVQPILLESQKVINAIPRISKNINKSFKVIKTKSFGEQQKTIHVIRKEYFGSNIDSASKICRKCKELKFLSEFVHGTNLCKQCKGLIYTPYDIVILYGEGKECTQCLDFKKWKEFCYCKNTNDKKSIYCRECRSLNIKLRLQTNINLRVSHVLRGRINTVLKGNKKSASTEELIGCTIEEFKRRFECLFIPGMTWDNHGAGKNGKGMKEWHIDHIIPCCKFNLSKDEEQRKCFHYSNLQPLWASDNMKKGGK